MPLDSSATLHEKAEEQRRRAESEEELTFDTLASKLGLLLTNQKIKVEDLMKEWDRNNDGAHDATLPHTTHTRSHSRASLSVLQRRWLT